MEEQEARDLAAKQRIITHMNDDHHDSVSSEPTHLEHCEGPTDQFNHQIVRYLEYYHGLSSWTAFGGKMTDITLDAMTFTCAGKNYRIPFRPSMSSYRDARERVVEMDKECLRGLGRSDITVKDFVPPTGLYIIDVLVIIATVIGYSQRWWFAPGAIVDQVFGASFARFSWHLQPWLVPGMVVLHGAELLHFERNYLRKHSVNPRTAVWWLWVFFGFIEGQFAYMRFKELVKKKAEEKQKQKH